MDNLNTLTKHEVMSFVKVSISLVLILFWITVICQLPGMREDYPFSHFGMYKDSIRPGPFTIFEVEVFRDGQDVSGEGLFDPYGINRKLKLLFLKTKRSKDGMLKVVSGELITTVDSALYRELYSHIQRDLQKKFQGTAVGSARVRILFKRWKHLSFETFRNSDQEVEVFDEIFSFPGS